MALVEIYTTSLCPYCFAAKRLLKKKNVAFDEFDIWTQPARREEMMSRAGGRTSVPQIFIDDVGIGGCDELHDLAENGELDRMLGLEDGYRQ